MKKLLVMSFICAAGMISCGKKIVPESDANSPSRSASDRTSGSTSTNTNSSSNTDPSFNDMKGAQTIIPDGTKAVSLDPGKSVYVTKCNGCHGLKNPGDYTVDQTYAFLKIEIPKAKLSKRESDDVTAYMIANARK